MHHTSQFLLLRIKHTLFMFLLLINIISAQNSSKISTKEKKSPNIVFILADDLGWMDLGIQGSKYYLTPNIDKLAKKGVRFTNAYAANPVCSPTRASIFSGKDPANKEVNITNWIGAQKYEKRDKYPLEQPNVGDELPLEEITFPEVLKNNGYATCFIGKWHLGETAEYWPEKQGFDINIAGWKAGNPGDYFAPYTNPRLTDGPDGEYLPFRLEREATDFIDEHQKQKTDQPFLLFLSMYNVHTPIQAPKDLVERFKKRKKELDLREGTFEIDKEVKNRTNQSDPTYAAMIWAMDSVVGRVEQKLEDLKIEDNTIVVFFSDNGGLSAPHYGVTTNRPLRGGKGWVYEGGIREPLIISYPPITENSPEKVIDEPVISYDFYPTLLDLAEVPLDKKQKISGLSFKKLIKGQEFSRGNLYWHYPHYSPQGGKPASVIRNDEWKLIYFYEDNVNELYNLKNDMSETNDVATKYPQVVKKMHKQLFKYLNKIGASYPKSK